MADTTTTTTTAKLDGLRNSVQSADDAFKKGDRVMPYEAWDMTKRIREALAGAKEGGAQLPPQLEQQMTDVLNRLSDATQLHRRGTR